MSYEDTYRGMLEHIEDLEQRITRLRKTVNWLRGANHDAYWERGIDDTHNGTVETCDAWECQRSREILNEGAVTPDSK